MHDAIIAERLEIPATVIITSAFVSAGELMSKVLGANGYPLVVVPHPISSATTASLAERARAAAAECVLRIANN